jgi:hypothetical protein
MNQKPIWMQIRKSRRKKKKKEEKVKGEDVREK